MVKWWWTNPVPEPGSEATLVGRERLSWWEDWARQAVTEPVEPSYVKDTPSDWRQDRTTLPLNYNAMFPYQVVVDAVGDRVDVHVYSVHHGDRIETFYRATVKDGAIRRVA